MSLITYLTRIHFAERVLEDALPEEMTRLGIRRVLVLHDGAAGSGEALDRLLCALPVHCDAVLSAAEDGGPDARAGSAATARDCDAVLGLGGRLALGLALRLAEPRTRGAAAALPVLAVPTTIGCVGIAPMPPGPAMSAAETALTAGSGRAAPRLPAVVLCDPTLTLQAAPAETAAAGMDALVHCIETFLATAWNPPADGMALEGVRRAGLWLVRAVERPDDVEARREMLAVALNGALAGQKGLGAVHALAHALEQELAESAPPAPPHPAPCAAALHGRLHAALLPPVLRFNAPAVGDRFATLAQALALPREATGAEALAIALADLGARIGLPPGLGRLALGRTVLDRAAMRAAEDPANLTNPRHATAADYRAMLQEAC